MSDFKDKKTLDEILADLNKILGKMPDLTQKLKAPEIKPIDFSAIADEKISPKTENAAPEESVERLQEQEKPSLEPVPEGQNENITAMADEEPLPAVSPVQETAGSNIDFVIEPQQDDGGAAGQPLNTQAFQDEDEKDAQDKILGNTADFGVPDIDFLMNLEQSHSGEDKKDESGPADLKNQPENIVLDGGEMEDNNQGKEKFEPKEENLQANENPAEPEKESTLSLNDSVIEPSPETAVKPDENAAEPAQEISLELNEPKSESGTEISLEAELEKLEQQPGSETPEETADAAQKTEDISEKTIVVDPSEINLQEPKKDENGGLILDLNLEVAPSAEQKEQPQDREKSAGIADGLEQFTLAVNDNSSNAADAPSPEEKTVVFEPSIHAAQPESSDSQEEKTVVFSPDETNRIPQSERDFTLDHAPASIPAERTKNAGFIFSDKNMLNYVLKTLDEICLASNEKPMFINRAFVFEYSDDLSPNMINQKASETSCQAVVAAGEFPHERIYELETVFSSSGIVFRHFKISDFSKSQAIDFVLDLIAK